MWRFCDGPLNYVVCYIHLMLAFHKLEALLHIQYKVHIDLETGGCEKRFLATLLARTLATTPLYVKVDGSCALGGISGLRKKIPSVHGRKRTAQTSTLTPGGRVETSLADTKWKRNFFSQTPESVFGVWLDSF